MPYPGVAAEGSEWEVASQRSAIPSTDSNTDKGEEALVQVRNYWDAVFRVLRSQPRNQDHEERLSRGIWRRIAASAAFEGIAAAAAAAGAYCADDGDAGSHGNGHGAGGTPPDFANSPHSELIRAVTKEWRLEYEIGRARADVEYRLLSETKAAAMGCLQLCRAESPAYPASEMFERRCCGAVASGRGARAGAQLFRVAELRHILDSKLRKNEPVITEVRQTKIL